MRRVLLHPFRSKSAAEAEKFNCGRVNGVVASSQFHFLAFYMAIILLLYCRLMLY